MFKKKLTRIAAGLAAALFAVTPAADLCGMPRLGIKASAADTKKYPYEYSIDAGDFTLMSNEILVANVDYYYMVNGSQKIVTILSPKPVAVRNNDNQLYGKASTSLQVQYGADANITLYGVDTDVSQWDNMPAFKIADDSKGNVVITLVGKNYLKSGNYCAGLQKSGSGKDVGKLTITGNGSLVAIGGDCSAGIGGGCGTYGRNGSTANIVIEGGTITAQAGTYSAGLGGGDGYTARDITLSGGSLNAIAGRDCVNKIGGGRGQEAIPVINSNGKSLYWFVYQAMEKRKSVFIDGFEYISDESTKCVAGYFEPGTIEKPLKVRVDEKTYDYIYDFISKKWLILTDATVVPAEGLKYNNRNQVLITEASASEMDVKVEFSFHREGGYTTVLPVAKDPGTYTIWYRAASGGVYTGKEPQSVEVTIADADKPKVKASAKKTSVTLSWDELDGAAKYAVYQLENGKYVKIATTKKDTYTVKNLKAGKTYKFMVRAFSYGKWTPADKNEAVTVKTLKK